MKFFFIATSIFLFSEINFCMHKLECDTENVSFERNPYLLYLTYCKNLEKRIKAECALLHLKLEKIKDSNSINFYNITKCISMGKAILNLIFMFEKSLSEEFINLKKPIHLQELKQKLTIQLKHLYGIQTELIKPLQKKQTPFTMTQKK